MKKITLIISIMFLALISCSETEEILPGNGENNKALITSVDIKDKNDLSVLLNADIDTVKFTVAILVKEGADITNLKLNASISEGATVKPIMDNLIDFSIPVKFAITSEDGRLTNNWFVIVREEKPGEAMMISIDDMKNKDDVSVLVSSEVDAENMTVSIVVKERTDTENLKLNASISEGATISPALGILSDFSLPFEYTITSKNGKSVNKWIVDVTVEEFIDHDSGFDYDLDPSEWILDDSQSDNFDNWDETRWSHYPGQTSSGVFDYSADNIIVAEGKLRIVADVDGEKYSAGKIKSAFEIGENTYVKIRAKTVNFQAMVTSSIGLQNEDIFPITLMETVLGGSDSFSSSLRQAGNVLIDSKTTSTDADLSGDYHVYGLERRNEYLRFFFDGEVVWEFETSQYPDLSEQLFNLVIGIDGKDGVEPNNSRLPGYLLVDYVAVYNAVNTDEIIPTYGDNLVKNPGFESAQGDDNPEGWTVTRSSGASEVWTFRDSHGYDYSQSRFHFGKVSDPSTFDYTISQSVNDLPDGLYRLEVWAFIVEGKSELDPLPRLFARGHGNAEKEIVIDNEGPDFDQSSWKKYVINNIYVSNGSCEIGVQAVSNGNGLYRVFIDDFSLVKVNY
ncbi:MAG: hypothetical protein PHG06_09225 [Parabacteroides sp.]|nr:hypothetical protein [Parabacteroides sp.]